MCEDSSSLIFRSELEIKIQCLNTCKSTELDNVTGKLIKGGGIPTIIIIK